MPNWKNRQMFSNREQGIMSGLDPVPMMAGGSVPYPGMETGGLFIPENENVDPSPKGDTLTEETKILNTMYNDIIKTMLETQTPFESIIENRLSQGSLTFKAAEALKKVFAIQKMRQTQKDSYPKDKGIDFFPSGPPTKRDALEYLDREQKMLQPSFPKMEVGGVVPQTQLFEEGDNELNASLNMMASVSNPDVPDMPMPMMDEKVEIREEATMDQGPDGFRMAVDDLKATFKSEIDNYISKAGVENIGKYLKSMSVAYNNQLNNLRKQFKVDKVDPEDQLFTEQFLAEFMTDVPGMQSGGVVLTQEQLDELFGEGKFPLNEWNKYSPDIQQFLLRKSQIAKLEQDAASATPQVDLSKLEALQAERRGLAKEAGSVASSAFSTTGSAAGELLGKRAAGRAAELSTMDTALADEIAVAKALVTAQAQGDIPGGLDIGFSAKEAEAFSLEEITKQKEERELLQNQWDEAVKAQEGKFGKALQLFINQTGGKLPPAYQDQERAIPGTGGAGNLLDYYKILLGKEEEAREAKEDFYLPDELNKWITFPVV